MIAPLSPDAVQAFCDSLPAKYRASYPLDSIAAHARLAAARGGEPVVIGRFDDYRNDASGVCLVADDRPGLLYLISAAIVACGLDVAAAEAYTRKGEASKKEAVDLFWLRRGEAGSYVPATDDDVESVRAILTELLQGARDPSSALPPAADGTPLDATVRFLDDKDGSLTTLEVETRDRLGLLLLLSRALYEQKVQIVRSEVRTVDGHVVDRFSVVEASGEPVSAPRRLELQVAVLGALDAARRHAPPKPA